MREGLSAQDRAEDQRVHQHIDQHSGTGLQASEAMALEECVKLYEYKQARERESKKGEDAAQDRQSQVCDEYNLRRRNGNDRARTVSWEQWVHTRLM